LLICFLLGRKAWLIQAPDIEISDWKARQ